MAVPPLVYWCENWTLVKQRERGDETAGMKRLRSVVGCTLCGGKARGEMSG
jgi:hypothetical protein